MAAAISPDMYATDRAVELADTGVPFRTAYRQVADELATLEARRPEDSLRARLSPGAHGAPMLAVLRERLTLAGWSGIGLTVVGTTVLVLGKGQGIDYTRGALILLFGAFAEAWYYILQKPFLRRYSGIEVSTWALIAATLPMRVGDRGAVERDQAVEGRTVGAQRFQEGDVEAAQVDAARHAAAPGQVHPRAGMRQRARNARGPEHVPDAEQVLDIEQHGVHVVARSGIASAAAAPPEEPPALRVVS